MPSSSRPQRRQTRLAFTPLPSSSPASKGYNKQIQDRAAAVTLSSSPGANKRRKMGDGGLEGISDSMPTPAASHQRQRRAATEEESESGSEPVRSTQRRTSTQMTTSRITARQQQRQLDFSNARDPSSFSSPIKLPSPARPQSPSRAGIFGTQKSRRVVDISSDEQSDEELPSPGKLVAKRTSKKLREGDRDSSATMTRSAQQAIAVDSESAEENIVVSSEPPKAIQVESDEDEDEDDMPTTAGTQRRKRARRKSRDSFIASSPPQMIDSDNDVEVIEPPKKRHRRDETEEVDENESEPGTPRRRLKPQRKASQREKNELEEDLDFLGPSSDVETSARKPRNTQTLAKDARQKALERLKRRRSKQVDESDQEEDNQENDGANEEEFDELYDDAEDEDQTRPVKTSQMFREDEHDQGFIDSEDEEENPLGIPEGVPLEFTRYASMKARELFKHAVEWFVQKKINPAFRMNDPIYDLTFKKLDDEVAGLAGSKFKSSVWTVDFKRSLEARPEIAFEQIDRDEGGNWMRDSCDACNRTNHPATYQIQFQGTPYYRETLDEVAQGDEDDDEDSSSESEYENNEPSYDAQDREIPPANKIYYVGKFCMSNAQTAHALEHWRYHLNEWVVTWLNKNGYGAPAEVVKRDAWSTKKRGKYANGIADRLEREGVVKQLYQDYRSNIDDARSSKQGRYSGWN